MMSKLQSELSIEKDQYGVSWIAQSHSVLDGTAEDLRPVFDAIEAMTISGEEIAGIRIRIPKTLGYGSWQMMRVSSNLYVILSKAFYHNSKTIHVAKERFAKARIVLSGKIAQLDANVCLNGTGAFLEAYPEDVGSQFEISGGQETTLIILNFDPNFFTKELKLKQHTIPRPLSLLFNAARKGTYGEVIPLGPDLLRAANDIYRAQTRIPSRLLPSYILSKGLEISCTMIAELERIKKFPPEVRPTSVRDLTRVEEAREIILSNLSELPTIPEIARLVGLNQTTLKSVFKLAYGMTIYEFAVQRRMELALELLNDTEHSVSEIAHDVGYDFPSSFSQAFKSFYGISPREMRLAIQGRIKAI